MSYPGAPVFWLTRLDTIEHSLRRYTFSGSDKPPCADGSTYHDASVFVGIEPARYTEREDGRMFLALRDDTPHDDPQWPTHCARCPYEFTDDDQWQDFQDQIYATPSGATYRLPGRMSSLLNSSPVTDAPPGAMWDAWWMGEFSRGPDGICLCVCLPNSSTWMVDSRASNCTMPDDNAHKCWCRHGDPRTEPHLLTVDKNGVTCAAGAGSIQADDYHGFLTNGQLTPG